jgi:hypothetical protein
MRSASTSSAVASVQVTTVPGTGSPATRSGRLDPESRRWVERLGADGPERDAAIESLHALLLAAARFEINRRRAAIPHLRASDHDDLAHQSADDALVAIPSKLADFRGDSRFTTWAYKFALLELAGADADRRIPGMRAHLAGCPACDEDHASLLAFVRGAG